MRKRILATAVLATTLLAAPCAALAQGGPGYGPGGGYGWGPGMMGGGPGMMGPAGPGWGREDGGPAWGRGGFGPGGGLAALNLTVEQQEKVAAIQEENRRKNWDAMGRVRSEQFKLRQMAFGEKIDPAAFAEQQKKVDDLRRDMLKSRVESRNQIDTVLTPEQRKQFRQFGPWWLQDADRD